MFAVQARGANGLLSEVATRAFTVDTVKPAVTLTRKPKTRTRKRRAKFVFKTSEPVASLACKLDRRRAKPCKSPRKVKVRPGRHRLKITATDLAGNVGRATAHRWKVLKPRRG